MIVFSDNSYNAVWGDRANGIKVQYVTDNYYQ